MRESPMKMFGAAGLALERAPFSSRMTVIDNVGRSVSGTDARETQFLARQPGLHGVAGQLGGNRLENAKHPGDRNELGMKLLAEHPRRELTTRPFPRAPAPRPLNMPASLPPDLPPRTHPRPDHYTTL